ncbi:NAD(P)H-dependent oxidoreductase [Mesorhizobium sp. M1312]|uniref:NAD(P)H-dependent oxidoreductase n=1 Tax=unclassified Mesorhizobium TaxID=325217 RepID=UPI00333E0227
MHALIVHSHPEPASFNSALTEVAKDTLMGLGHSVKISDLYAERFDPVEKPEHYRNRKSTDFFATTNEQRHASETCTLPEDVVREIARLKRANLVVFQFPLWNHGVPAILKGWFDRVFVSGGIHTSGMRHDRGFFRGIPTICSVTTGAEATAFEPYSYAGDINGLMYPIASPPKTWRANGS